MAIQPVDDPLDQTGTSPLRRELSFQDQSSRLPFRRLLVIYLGIGVF